MSDTVVVACSHEVTPPWRGAGGVEDAGVSSLEFRTRVDVDISAAVVQPIPRPFAEVVPPSEFLLQSSDFACFLARAENECEKQSGFGVPNPDGLDLHKRERTPKKTG